MYRILITTIAIALISVSAYAWTYEYECINECMGMGYDSQSCRVACDRALDDRVNSQR